MFKAPLHSLLWNLIMQHKNGQSMISNHKIKKIKTIKLRVVYSVISDVLQLEINWVIGDKVQETNSLIL